MKRFGTLFSIALLCVAAVTMNPACVPAAPTPESSATARKTLSDFYAAVSTAKTMSAEFYAEVSVKQNGEVVNSDSTTYRFAAERPQRLAVVVAQGEGVSFINDAKQTYQYVAALNKYQRSEPGAAKYAELLDERVLRFANFGQGLSVVGDALGAESVDAFLALYESPEFIGEEETDGTKTQHVRVFRDDMPVDLWFSGDATKLLRFEPDMKAGLAAQGRTLPPGVELRMSIKVKNWTADAALPADAFAISPPSGAELVDDLFAPPVHALLGKQAPAFETTTSEGAPLKLADLAGKVVMLDFWATWCGPCIAALPKINEVAKKYKDKGVVFYAVNQQEEASIIKEFLASQKLQTVPVAMDLEGKLGQAFGVEGIPQTVIIDKAGKVQVVHVGAGPDIGDQLTKELDAILAGKDLAGDRLKKKE